MPWRVRQRGVRISWSVSLSGCRRCCCSRRQLIGCRQLRDSDDHADTAQGRTGETESCSVRRRPDGVSAAERVARVVALLDLLQPAVGHVVPRGARVLARAVTAGEVGVRPARPGSEPGEQTVTEGGTTDASRGGSGPITIALNRASRPPALLATGGWDASAPPRCRISTTTNGTSDCGPATARIESTASRGRSPAILRRREQADFPLPYDECARSVLPPAAMRCSAIRVRRRSQVPRWMPAPYSSRRVRRGRCRGLSGRSAVAPSTAARREKSGTVPWPRFHRWRSWRCQPHTRP